MLVTILTFAALFFGFLICLWYLVNCRYLVCLRHIPGPVPLPLVGSAWRFSSLTKVLPVLMEMKQKYGRLYQVYLGFQPPSLTISDPELIEYILTSPKILTKTVDYEFLHAWLGTGLLTSTGSKWRKRRKIITPAFHFKILEGFVDTFEKNATIMVNIWEREIGEKSFDVYPYVTLLALDIICETALGTKINAQLLSHSDFVESVKEMGKIVMERTFNPLLQNDLLFKCSNTYRREKKALNIIHNKTESVIRKRKMQMQEKASIINNHCDGLGIKRKYAFLDLLLQATIDDKPLSDADLREEVDTFVFEGHDTTASCISFALYLLSKHPEVQCRILEELVSVLSGDILRPCTFWDLQKMKYLEAVIKETLRIYPSVPMFARCATEDIIHNNKLIPRGTRLTIFVFGLLRDPHIFPEPEKFIPERFLTKSENVRNPFCYIPFSAGSRNCLGQKFAMLEMKSTLSTILRKYELLPAEPSCEALLSPEITLKSINGIRIKIRKRL